MGATGENLHLSWNDFESNISSSFRQLRDESHFCDVALATSDSGPKSLRAHKVILSACSAVFKDMLTAQAQYHAHANPLIFLRGVSYHNLSLILTFMYNGEVDVALMALPLDLPDLEVEALFDDELFVVLPADHALAAQDEELLPPGEAFALTGYVDGDTVIADVLRRLVP